MVLNDNNYKKNINYIDIEKFKNYIFRLPTKYEWEYTVRGKKGKHLSLGKTSLIVENVIVKKMD